MFWLLRTHTSPDCPGGNEAPVSGSTMRISQPSTAFPAESCNSGRAESRWSASDRAVTAPHSSVCPYTCTNFVSGHVDSARCSNGSGIGAAP